MDKAIVCVDDEAIILMALKRELRTAIGTSFVYESAADGNEALAVIDSLVAEGVRVVLLITDWMMPGLKGDELVREVRKRHPDIRAILVTGQADEEKMEELRREGALSAVFRKPWSREGLEAAVRACIETEGLLSEGGGA
jgi:CheY-like chemotaxis protein